MSSAAPIRGTEELKEAFKDKDFGYLQVNVDMDKQEFILTQKGPKADEATNWKTVQSLMKDKQHSYFILQDPLQADDFVIVHWGPDLSTVKQRMIYASSRQTLKSFLGSSAFQQDYFINDRDECSAGRLRDQRTLNERIDFRSDAEIDKEAALYDTVATTTSSSVMQKLPIELKGSAKDAMGKYKSDAAKVAFFSLDTEDQSVSGEVVSCRSIGEIRDALPDKEPRYLLFWHTREREDDEKSDKGKPKTVRVFGYFCPDEADRKLKFTYSTCKANVIEYATEIESIEFGGKVEFTEKKDFSNTFLDYHVFPRQEKKEEFKRVAPGGRRGRRRRSKTNLLADE